MTRERETHTHTDTHQGRERETGGRERGRRKGMGGIGREGEEEGKKGKEREGERGGKKERGKKVRKNYIIGVYCYICYSTYHKKQVTHHYLDMRRQHSMIMCAMKCMYMYMYIVRVHVHTALAMQSSSLRKWIS